MKKIIITIFSVIAIMFVVTPVNTRALSISDTAFGSVYVLDEDIEPWLGDTDQEQTCDGSSNSLLGDTEDPDSVAWLVQHIFNFIKVIGPILVVLLSSIDFTKVIVKSDDEAMAKAQKKLILRLILAAALFVIPTIVEVILDVFGMTTNGTCGIK